MKAEGTHVKDAKSLATWMRTWRADDNMIGDFARDYFECGACQACDLSELRGHLYHDHEASDVVLSIFDAVHVLATANRYATDKPIVLALGIEVGSKLWDLAGERPEDQAQFMSDLIEKAHADADFTA